MYQNEEELKSAAQIATGLCLLILFTGLFGILAFSLNRRAKEIALRKVLGANAGNIFLLFIREYGLLILLSNLIGWPLAFIASQSWLEEFAFRISQGPGPYLAVSIIIFTLTAGLIILQSAKAVFESPAQRLRNE
jgi:ABC-type antimicrobial peptide transport system permease subunit